MNIILLGPPGAGKGTQSQLITESFNLVKISTGDMLRQAVSQKTELGLQAKHCMQAGELVPDSLIIELVKEKLASIHGATGCLFDGFPRTVAQAEALRAAQIKIDYVIEINVPEANIINRMSGRLVHAASGRVYHLTDHPPKVSGQDDITGEPLEKRSDDAEATVRERLSVYRQKTTPLIQYYQSWSQSEDQEAPQYFKVSGIGRISEVRDRIFDIIG